MSNRDPRRLADCLADGPLGALAREAERRRLATEDLRKLLPADEATHLVSAATDSNGELVIVMDSPSWAARVRYSIASSLSARVRIKVVPRGG
ncbi:MAG TPA: DciA family protein [Gammaproteobacteria bacterium]|nr:DciA family protein [Gammaproteobacteria bacterium]